MIKIIHANVSSLNELTIICLFWLRNYIPSSRIYRYDEKIHFSCFLDFRSFPQTLNYFLNGSWLFLKRKKRPKPTKKVKNKEIGLLNSFAHNSNTTVREFDFSPLLTMPPKMWWGLLQCRKKCCEGLQQVSKTFFRGITKVSSIFWDISQCYVKQLVWKLFFCYTGIIVWDHSFSTFAKISRKSNISYP